MNILRRGLLWTAVLLIPACGGGAGGASGGPPSPIVLIAPTGLVSYSLPDKINLRWKPVAGASGYVLYSATVPGVTPANYSSLAGGAKTAVASPFTFSPVVNGTTYYFVLTATAGAVESPPSPQIFDSPSLPAILAPPSVGDYHTLTGQLRAVVHDPVHRRVYATNETGSSLEILDEDADGLLVPLPLGGQPWGLDLSPDFSKLFVCLPGTSEIVVINLNLPYPSLQTRIAVPADATGASKPRNIAVAANGRAFFGCQDAGAGYTILRELNIGSFAISFRTDLNSGQFRDPTYIAASRDRSHLLFGQGGTGGDFAAYSSASNTFVGSGNIPTPISYVSVNDDGTQFALCPGPYILGADLRQRGVWVFGSGNFEFLADPDRGFTAGGPFRISTFSQIGGFTTPAPFIQAFKLDAAGKTMYGIGASGILKAPIDGNQPPRLINGGGVTVNVGESASWRQEFFDWEGDTLEYYLDNFPPNAVFDPSTKVLTFTPSLAQAGLSVFATLYATDGWNAASASIFLSATNPASYPFRSFPEPGIFGNEITDLTYDPVRDRVYLANQDGAAVVRIQVGTNSQLPSIPTLGAPGALDVNVGATRLVVCPLNSEFVQVFDLTVEPPVLLASIPIPDGATPDQRHPHRVAVAANGHALVSTIDNATGASRLCDVNLANNTILVRPDIPGGTMTGVPSMRASRDRATIVVMPSTTTPKAGFLYSSGSNSFGSSISLTGGSTRDLDVNTNGTRIITGGGPAVYDGNLALLGTVTGGGGLRAGIRQGTTTGYRVLLGPTMDIFDLETRTTTGTFNGPQNPFGPMISDAAGTRLFMALQRGFAIVTLP